MADTEHLNSDHNIESIISAPLVALSKANMMMLAGQTTFLLNNCFQLRNGVYEPVMITMSIQVGGATGQAMTFQMPLINLLSDFGILEMAKTGTLAIERGRSSIYDDNKLREEYNYGKNVL